MRPLTDPRFSGVARAVVWVASRLVFLGAQQLLFALTWVITGDPYLDHTFGTNYGFGIIYLPIFAVVVSAGYWFVIDFCGALQSRHPGRRKMRRGMAAIVSIAVVLEGVTSAFILLAITPNYPATVTVVISLAVVDALLLVWMHRPSRFAEDRGTVLGSQTR